MFLGEIFIYILILFVVIVTGFNLYKYFKRKEQGDFKNSFEDLLEHNKKAIKSEDEKF